MGDFIHIRFGFYHLFFLNSMLGLVSCFCSLLNLMSGSFFGLTSGLPFSPSRLIFTLVPILKLGDDISILLLKFLTFPIRKFISLGSMYTNSPVDHIIYFTFSVLQSLLKPSYVFRNIDSPIYYIFKAI